MAANYFPAIAGLTPSVAPLAAQLRLQCLKISANLSQASHQTMDAAAKIEVLQETKQLETAAMVRVETLATALRTQTEQ